MGVFSRRVRRKVPAVSAEPREAFLAEVQAMATGFPAVTKLLRLEDAFGLAVWLEGQGGPINLYLDNLYAECRQLPPEHRSGAIQRFLEALTDKEEAILDWEEARPRLRSILRASLFIGQPEEEARVELSCREVLPCLREHLVIDLPDSMDYVRSEDAVRWDVGHERLYAAAHANLRPQAAEGLELYEQEPSRIWCVDTGDGYESSRLLLPGFLASFAGRVDGKPVAVAPERSMLFIGGDANPATVVRLCELAKREFLASPRRVSAAIYSVDPEGGVIPYHREADDAAALRVREAHLSFVGGEYALQKKGLDEAYEKRGVDVFVASFSSLQSAGGADRSFCVWTDGIDGLLPQTDLVAITQRDETREVLWVSWDTAHRLVGDCLVREPRMFPPRWRTVRPLSDEQLTALAAAHDPPPGR